MRIQTGRQALGLLTTVAMSGLLLLNSTAPVYSQGITSSNGVSARAIVGDSWTWTEAGKSAAEWAAGSAVVAGGATLAFGTPAAGPAAAVCGAAGAVGGFAAYAAGQAWDYFFGE